MSTAINARLSTQIKWKTVAIIVAVIAIPLSIIGQAMAYDEPKYTTVKTDSQIQNKISKKIELRQYESIMVAEINIEAKGWNSAARQAFRPLANFIFGSNNKDEKIGMTIPVTTHSTQENRWTVAFVMPERYSEQNLPKPFGNEIGIVTKPPRLMAAIRFSGRIGGQTGDRNFKRAEARLREALDALQIKPSGPAIYAVYNGPFTPFFFRRNEVLLPIDSQDVNVPKSEVLTDTTSK